jgi:hypothetical protein
MLKRGVFFDLSSKASRFRLFRCKINCWPEERFIIMKKILVFLAIVLSGCAPNTSAQVSQIKATDVMAYLRFPNYRGFVAEKDTTPWQVEIEVEKSLGNDQEKFLVTAEVVDNSGKTITSEKVHSSLQKKNMSFTLQETKNMPLGSYLVKLTIDSESGQKIWGKEFPVQVLKEMPRVYIDKQGFTVVEGKRFFPLGIYTGSKGAPKDVDNSADYDLKRMADIGLNTVLSYDYALQPDTDGIRFLNDAKKNNMMVVYTLKDLHDGRAGYPKNGISGQEAAEKQINLVKDHPSLLAWYINDEMDGKWLDPTQERYNQVSRMDPNHPAYIVYNHTQKNSEFFPMCDVFGMDEYPIGNTKYSVHKLSEVGKWTKYSSDFTRGVKGLWEVIQIHNLIHAKYTQDRNPTLDEMRNMAYQTLTNGSKGLFLFAYHWLYFDLDKEGKRIYDQKAFDKRWADIQKLIQEIEPFTDVILEDQKVDLKVVAPSSVKYQAWQDQNKLYVMVVNTSEDKPKTLKLQIPAGWRLSDAKVPGVKSQFAGNALSLSFDPVASGIVVLER